MTSTNINPTNVPMYEDPVMSAVREKLSVKLRTGFVELIPQEVFDNMTTMAIDEFVNGPRSKRFKQTSNYLNADDHRNTTGKAGYVIFEHPIEGYNPVSDPSTLPGMIYLEIVKLAKENIAKAISEDPKFASNYDNEVGNMVIPVIQDIVGNNTEAFVRSLMSNVVNYTMVNAVNALRSSQGMGNYIPQISGVKL